jgi:hypothetical protein
MPKAPRKAQLTIVLLAVLAIVYGASVIHLNEDGVALRHAAPAQLIVVRLHSAWMSLKSSDASVVAPISVSLRPITTGYFIALKPGQAGLQAIDDPCPSNMTPPRCMLPARIWVTEIDVWPG